MTYSTDRLVTRRGTSWSSHACSPHAQTLGRHGPGRGACLARVSARSSSALAADSVPQHVTPQVPTADAHDHPQQHELYVTFRPSPVLRSSCRGEVRVARVKKLTLRRPDRPYTLISHTVCASSSRCATDLTSPAERRADELLAPGAACTSCITTLVRLAWSETSCGARSTARCRELDLRRAAAVAGGALATAQRSRVRPPQELSDAGGVHSVREVQPVRRGCCGTAQGGNREVL